ncbi:MAG: hypothetical protein JRJ43_11660 [Deltaproteobacteria bacterium]|nr:hypothetical protein [Deltaproteobacteria bacterium]
MMKRLVIFTLFCLIESAVADGELSDSMLVLKDGDTTRITDTLSYDSISEDSLIDNDTTLSSFEERYELFKKKRERRPGLSYFDSLAAYFTSERLNQRRQVDQSFFHDAGDYFRFDPSFFILEHQVTPMRKTVQPFGLSGDRLNLLVDGYQLEPFEHIPEPDGLTDLNDVPTALDGDIFVLPGPVGQIFGGDKSVATLLTRPRNTSSYLPECAILADKGSFGYSYVRGRYSKRFVRGREIDMSIGYREAYGPTYNRKDDAYHYYGNFYFPIGETAGLRAWGQLYNRDGNFVVQPGRGGMAALRERFDRIARLSYDFHNSDHTARNEIGYKHLRKGSYLTGVYKSRLNLTGHGAFVLREWISERTIFKTQVDGDYLEYDDGFQNLNRTSTGLLVSAARLVEGYRWALTVGTRYVEDFDILPSFAGVLFREWSKFFLLFSVGYSERAPSLTELHLPFQKAPVYGSGADGYAECGNSELKKERQLIVNVTVELGSPETNLGLSVTGGKIFDGIDWQNQPITDSVGSYLYFSPANGNIDFVDTRFQPKIRIKDFISFTVGGAYHYLNYDSFEDKAYSPEYQFFSGMELHVYWPQRLLDLYAYGEIVYTGPYDGYNKKGLGQELLANAKLSFGLKDFRFNFVFQNVLSNVYQSREYITFPGRYFYYSLTWSFLN